MQSGIYEQSLGANARFLAQPIFVQDSVSFVAGYEYPLSSLTNWESILSITSRLVDLLRRCEEYQPLLLFTHNEKEKEKIKIFCLIRDGNIPPVYKIYQEINNSYQFNLDANKPFVDMFACFVAWIMHLKKWDLSWLGNKYPIESKVAHFWLEMTDFEKYEKQLSSFLYDHHHKTIGF
ncbi:MAG: hypothetical protein KatS3mg087_1750 [Patescibacteria group bacterium]|nr:MAG: hypothetical protein KatS3mg087_1750 [Patescibacteria group bacterium]